MVGATGFSGVVEFLTLTAPSEFPDFRLGIYDATTTPVGSFLVSGEGAFAPVSGEVRVLAVPEPAGAMALGVILLVGLWWLMNRRARTA